MLHTKISSKKYKKTISVASTKDTHVVPMIIDSTHPRNYKSTQHKPFQFSKHLRGSAAGFLAAPMTVEKEEDNTMSGYNADDEADFGAEEDRDIAKP